MIRNAAKVCIRNRNSFNLCCEYLKNISFNKMVGDLIKNKIFMIILIIDIVFTSVLFLSNYTRIEVHTEPQNDLQPTKQYITYKP